MSKIIYSILSYGNHILNTAAVFSEQVNTRLNGYYLPGSQGSFRRYSRKSRALVDKQTYAVTERMPEGAGIISVDDARSITII